LDPVAREVWTKVGQDLINVQVLTELDLTAFAVYCQSVSVHRRLKEDLDRERRQHGGVPGNPGTRGTATALRLLDDAARTVLTLGKEFGLSPSGRVRLGGLASRPPVPTKFAGLLGRN
jgi:P27 family predicted phage terminase small subunit